MENAIVFGKYDHLLGIESTADTPNEPKVAMIIMTAGMLHNVGPYRLYVDVARELAGNGIPSLRFDISGIGDSFGVGISGKSIDRAASEASDAMTYLTDKYGIKEFILFGLCSGADDSIQAALSDERVKGVITLDGLGFKTTKFKIREIILTLRQVLRAEHWVNKYKRTFSKASVVPVSLATGSDVREHPDTPQKAAKELQQLIDRNTQLHFIYTGGTDYYNYAQQLYDMLPDVNWKGTESTQYFPEMDHVVTLCDDRKKMVKHIADKTLEMVVC